MNSSHLNFGDLSYWENRYNDNKNVLFKLFDWYCPFDLCYPTIESLIDTKKKHKLLLIGIGKSGAIEILYKNGFRDIICVDISPTIISIMQQKYIKYSGVEFMCMDVCKMNTFPDNHFSLVIDKACLDALFCQIDYKEAISQALIEIHRVLKVDGGVFASVSQSPPITRVPYFREINWAVEVLPLQPGYGDGLSFYSMTRTANNVLLNKEIKGGEFAYQIKSKNLVMSLDQNMNKISTIKIPKNIGSLTVTSTAELLEDLVNECERIDKIGVNG